MKQTFKVTVQGDLKPDMASWLKMVVDTSSWEAEVELLETVDEEFPGPLVSILLPNWNYGHRIGRMIQSLRSQTFKDFELIVCDDGSTDDSVQTIRKLLGPGDRLLCHGSNQGAAAAINTAASFARGKYWTWVSSDNEMTPDWLQRLLDLMGSTVGVTYANYDRFNDDGPQQGTWGKPYDPTRLLNDQNCYIGPAFLVRASIWRETGPLRGKNSCDYDHWLRLEETCLRSGYSFAYCSDVLCHYYSGPERATVARRQDYDAPKWQEEARRRRGAFSPATA